MLRTDRPVGYWLLCAGEPTTGCAYHGVNLPIAHARKPAAWASAGADLLGLAISPVAAIADCRLPALPKTNALNGPARASAMP